MLPVWFQLSGSYSPAARGPLGPAFGALALSDDLVLAGCAIGGPVARRLRLPAAWLVGPMVLSALVHLTGLTASRPPGLLIAAAQVVVGSFIGCRFAGLGAPLLGRIVLVAAGLATSNSLGEAYVDVLLGENDAALDVLERGIATDSTLRDRAARLPWFTPLRGTPRFDALVRPR